MSTLMLRESHDSSINSFMRQSNGSLIRTDLNTTDFPLPPDPNEPYQVANVGASDPYGNLLVGLVLFDPDSGEVAQTQLAVFTADKFGKLSTDSTAANMASLAINSTAIAMSPHGYYVATTGAGLQLFLMHGGGQVAALTGAILPNVSMGRAFWDNNEHLYVPATDKLYVFNVGTAGVNQVEGSPYSVPNGGYVGSVIVLPKR